MSAQKNHRFAKAQEKAKHKVERKWREKMMLISPLLVSAIHACVNHLSDEGADADERKKLLAELYAIQRLARDHLPPHKPHLTIIHESGYVDSVVSDLPIVIGNLFDHICVVDFDIEDENDPTLPSVRFPDGQLYAAEVTTILVEKARIHIEDSEGLMPPPKVAPTDPVDAREVF